MNEKERDPNPTAVAWYVEQTQRLLEDQQERVESLRARAGQLATFSGAVLALVGANAGELIERAGSGCSRTVIGVAILVGVSFLTGAVVIALLRGLRPTIFTAISSNEIDNYLSPRFIDEPELWRVHIRTIKALKRAVVRAE